MVRLKDPGLLPSRDGWEDLEPEMQLPSLPLRYCPGQNVGLWAARLKPLP